MNTTNLYSERDNFKFDVENYLMMVVPEDVYFLKAGDIVFIDPDDRGTSDGKLYATYTNGEIGIKKLTFKRHNGIYIQYESHHGKLTESESEIIGIVCSAYRPNDLKLIGDVKQIW